MRGKLPPMHPCLAAPAANEQDLISPAHLRANALRIGRARVDDGHGGVLPLQQQRRGHAHNVAATHHCRALATQL